ncbi:VOC family protein [Actinomadura sp. WMMB 499]|uniref:VOC family protein n=1 Tax=Actinomadura sp. WMMB 499 TaxID=1219491 RepID=UPI0012446763|nr:VOC family protein [Actinomadura sp. WMMB 499]QFG21525.1 VOC family protein [Actinomadura sp. WMMB 499]
MSALPEIDRTIYPMPMFATFQVADLAAAEAFYNAAGFVSLATVPGPDGSPAVVHLRRMKYQDILIVPGEPERGSVTVSFLAGGQDLAELAAALRPALPDGARVEGPADTPWYTSDLTIDDPDGNRIVLTAQRAAEREAIEEWARTFEGDFIVEE